MTTACTSATSPATLPRIIPGAAEIDAVAGVDDIAGVEGASGAPGAGAGGCAFASGFVEASAGPALTAGTGGGGVSSRGAGISIGSTVVSVAADRAESSIGGIGAVVAWG